MYKSHRVLTITYKVKSVDGYGTTSFAFGSSSLISSRDSPDVDACPVSTIPQSAHITPLSGVVMVVRNPTVPRDGNGNEKSNDAGGLMAGMGADHS